MLAPYQRRLQRSCTLFWVRKPATFDGTWIEGRDLPIAFGRMGFPRGFGMVGTVRSLAHPLPPAPKIFSRITRNFRARPRHPEIRSLADMHSADVRSPHEVYTVLSRLSTRFLSATVATGHLNSPTWACLRARSLSVGLRTRISLGYQACECSFRFRG